MSVSATVWLASRENPPRGGFGGAGNEGFGEQPDGDELPYRIELLDADGGVVQQVLAVSLSAAIGYAAYYAAIREYPDRIVVLRHESKVVSRSGSRTHLS